MAMCKNPRHEWVETVHLSDIFKRLKRWKLLEPSLGILGFFFGTFCVLVCLFFVDYKTSLGSVYKVQRESQVLWLKFNSSPRGNIPNFLDSAGDECDIFEGEWVWDEDYPLYHSRDCSFLDEGFRCNENNRPDFLYTKWRWQPNHCNLPRFDAKIMLEKARNKRVVFAGDSIGRNQWESLLCMLSSSISNKDSIYEVNGSPITKHNGYLVFKFADYNCTLEYYRSPFLVKQSRPPRQAAENIKMTIKLDQMDWYVSNWRDADVLIFNSGHWWNYEKTLRSGSYFQERSTVQLDMKIETAYRKATETVIKWIQSEVDPNKTQVFYRTLAPVHFRGGDWRTGGHCHLETLPELGSSLVPSDIWHHFAVAGDLLAAHRNSTRNFFVLNITSMAGRRKDGHPSLYYLGPEPASMHRQDCSHWCLPGVPDAWNELLYALFVKHGNTSSPSKTTK